MSKFRTWILDAGSWLITFAAALAGVVIATFGVDGAASWGSGTALVELTASVAFAARVVERNHKAKSETGKRLNLKFRVVHMFTTGAASRVIAAGLAQAWILLRPLVEHIVKGLGL